MRDEVRTKEPRRTSVVLHADHDIVPRDNGRYAISEERTSLVIGVAPSLASTIEPHFVITQGCPGSVENGEREQRGSRLTLSTAPQTASRIEMRLVVEVIQGSQP